MNRKGFAPIIILLVLAVILAAGGVWYYESHRSSTSQTLQNLVSQTSQPTSTPDAVVATSTTASIPGWTIYTNRQYGFEFQYPSNWMLDATSSDSGFSSGALSVFGLDLTAPTTTIGQEDNVTVFAYSSMYFSALNLANPTPSDVASLLPKSTENSVVASAMEQQIESSGDTARQSYEQEIKNASSTTIDGVPAGFGIDTLGEGTYGETIGFIKGNYYFEIRNSWQADQVSALNSSNTPPAAEQTDEQSMIATQNRVVSTFQFLNTQ